MNIFKNTFIVGLLLALSVVATDYINSIISGAPMSINALIIAALIAVVGYVGKSLTGSANTNVAMIGSALLAIVPMLSGTTIDWKLIALAFLVKLIGLFSEGQAKVKAPPQVNAPNNARV